MILCKFILEYRHITGNLFNVFLQHGERFWKFIRGVISVNNWKRREIETEMPKHQYSLRARFPLFCFYHILTSSAIYEWTQNRHKASLNIYVKKSQETKVRRINMITKGKIRLWPFVQWKWTEMTEWQIVFVSEYNCQGKTSVLF